MDYIKFFFDFILHIDKHLLQLVQDYNTGAYWILALIVFCETGLVVTPFLPGDSLLFTAGTIAAAGYLNPWLLLIILFVAAFTGDNLNYFIGNFVGPRVLTGNYRFLKKEYLHKTHAFYEKHGGKTIIIARFMPIIRTFAPFVAGVGSMKYPKFLSFSVLGNLLWIILFLFAGYKLGEIDFVKKHFTGVIFGIIFISLAPGIITFLKHRFSKK